MTLRNDLVASGRKYLGYTESPYGSNCNKFSARLHRPCERWCGDAWTCFHLDVGINMMHDLTPYTASTDAIWVAGKNKGWVIPKSAAMPGDTILCDFAPGGGPEHIEYITRVTGGRFWSLGGNTGHGRLANGGGVYEQERHWSDVLGALRHPLLRGVVATPPPIVEQPTQPTTANLVKFLRVVGAREVLDDVKAMPNLDPGRQNRASVAVLQRALNIVRQAGIPEDGSYGPLTVMHVVAFQNDVARMFPNAPRDFPGAAHEATRFFLVAALTNIAKGIV